MPAPELQIITINIAIILIGYFLVYPKFCDSSLNKIMANDVLASAIVLIIAGSMYWGSGQEFSLVFVSVNWFWFTLLSYATIEIPFMLWYFKKHDVWSSIHQ